jgi:hypothetical protein
MIFRVELAKEHEGLVRLLRVEKYCSPYRKALGVFGSPTAVNDACGWAVEDINMDWFLVERPNLWYYL